MGKNKTFILKTISKKILEKYEDILSSKFEENKVILKDIILNMSKTQYNLVCGRVTHIYNVKKKKEEIKNKFVGLDLELYRKL